MARTSFDLTAWTSDESWRSIRTLRAALPDPISVVLAEDRDRADVFHAALEQAQQLFAAASVVGYESRPLLLFYGLGQAGRAIAAASDRLAISKWAANGHGLKARLREVTPSDPWSAGIAVTPTTRDLFSRVSVAVGSPIDIGSTTLGAVAVGLLEFAVEFREFRDHLPVLVLSPVYPSQMQGAGDGARLARYPISVGSLNRPSSLTRYPALRPYNVRRTAAGGIYLDHNGDAVLEVPIADLDNVDGSFMLRTRQLYRGQNVALPAFGDAEGAVHPLMAWWLALYTLSMLARYEPRTWSRLLAIRDCRYASHVEYLQDAALQAVPQIIAETLGSLNDC